MTDYKELCAELVTELEGWCGTGTYDNTVNAHSVIDRARTLLAQSEPEVFTDEEIMELMPQQIRDDLAAAARAMAEQAGTDSRRAMGIMRIILNRHAVDHVRAALAKWGHQ